MTAAAATDIRKAAGLQVLRWRADPVAFVREALRVEPQEWQAVVLKALVTKDKIAIRSGHGVGKSSLMSWIILWWLTTRYPAKVACTAPTAHQLYDVLWSELARWSRQLPDQIKANFEWKSERYEVKGAGNESFAVARTARLEQPEALQGFHCMDEAHTILTRRGWLGIDEIREGDEVLSCPVNGQKAEWMPVTAVHRHDFVGYLNVHDSRSVSFAVTDNHRFPTKYLERVKKWHMREYKDMAGQFMVRRTSGWSGTPITVPEAFARRGWDAERFARFVGFWIGDGGTREHSSGLFYEILLYQSKAKHCAELEEMLDGVAWTRGRDYYGISDRGMCEWLMEHIGRYGHDRVIPRFLLDAPTNVLNALLDGLWLAEGSMREDGHRGQFYNTSLLLMDQVQEVMIKLNRPCTIGVNVAAGVEKVANGISFKAQHDCLVLTQPTIGRDALIKKTAVRREKYSGRVWCISTPHETFYTRRKGRVFLSGNSPNMLFLVDEASGVPDIIFEVGEGSLSTAGAKVVLAGNPTRTSGYFFDAFHRSRAQWTRFKVSCLDSPMVAPGFIESMKDKYGEDSNVYSIRVLGDFPRSEDDVCIPLNLLEDATQRVIAPAEGYKPIWGVDVARYGDDRSALSKRHMNRLLEPTKNWSQLDTMQLAGTIINEYRETPIELRPGQIMVDVIGIGSGVVDRLREEKMPVRGINVAESASTKARFARLRDELWWSAREWFQTRGVWIPDDSDLISELSSVKYALLGSGKLKIESKDEMKKRGMRSPDVADSFILTFAGRAEITPDRQEQRIREVRMRFKRRTTWMAG